MTKAKVAETKAAKKPKKKKKKKQVHVLVISSLCFVIVLDVDYQLNKNVADTTCCIHIA